MRELHRQEDWKVGGGGVTVLTGHDPEGERELQQRNLKAAGQSCSVWPDSSVNTSLVSVLGLTRSWTFPFSLAGLRL